MELLTVQDVAAILKISKSLLYGLIASNKIVCRRIGNHRGVVRICPDELEGLLENCRGVGIKTWY